MVDVEARRREGEQLQPPLIAGVVEVFHSKTGTVRNFVLEAMMMERRIITWPLRKNFWTIA
jgi:hypothetical protein